MTDPAGRSSAPPASEGELGVRVRLGVLTRQLSDRGYNVESLRALDLELEVLERPQGLVRRMTSQALATAGRHWRNFVGELKESGEVMALLMGRLQGGRLSPEERDKIRAQLVDLVKVFPAGIIAAANSAFPVPGTGLFTPWILARLDLMPSQWREAHLIAQLHKQRDQLLDAGLADAAAELEELERQVHAQAAQREQVGACAGLLTHWDANRNGVWDPDECAAYVVELERVRALAQRHRARKRWFLEDRGQIFGALRLSELLGDPELEDHLGDDGLLVCFDGKTGWVALPDLLGRTPRFS
ncbi:MAG: hypothetical protein AAGF11_53850 [Myxococcota bacterium]